MGLLKLVPSCKIQGRGNQIQRDGIDWSIRLCKVANDMECEPVQRDGVVSGDSVVKTTVKGIILQGTIHKSDLE